MTGDYSVVSVFGGVTSAAIPIGLSLVWFVGAPKFVHVLNPRLHDRNKDHFTKLVRFSRVWGIVAVLAGVLVGRLV